MDIFTRIIAFFMSVIVSIGGWFQFFKPAIPEAKSVEELAEINMGFKKVPLADELYVVETSRVNGTEFRSMQCLQGLANKEKVQIFMSNGWMANSYLDDIKNSGIKLI